MEIDPSLPPRLIDLLLWLYIVNLGTAFGAGLYEARIVVPQWAGRLPESLYRWNRRARHRPDPLHFWAVLSTWSLTALAVLCLTAAWLVGGMRMGWLMASAAIVLAERAMTFAYFIPTAHHLEHAEAMPRSKVKDEALEWARLNYVRTAMTFFAWLAAMKAQSLTTY